MKMTKMLIVAAATAVSQLLTVHSANAQNTFRACVSAVAISTNEAGDLTYHKFGNGDLIRQCAAEQGVTNLMGLHVVYDLTTDAIEVVSGTNNTVLCSPLTFSGGVFLSNSNSTCSQRLSWVYWESGTTASGTLAASEHYQYGVSNQLTGFNLNGQLQFAVPGSGTNAPVIYRGRVVAGSDFFDRFGGDDSQSLSSPSGQED